MVKSLVDGSQNMNYETFSNKVEAIVLRKFDGTNTNAIQGHNFRHLAYMINNPENDQVYVDFDGMMRGIIGDKNVRGFGAVNAEISIVRQVLDMLIPNQSELETKLFDIVGKTNDLTNGIVKFNDAHITTQRLIYGDGIVTNGNNSNNSLTASSTLKGAVLNGQGGADTLTGNNYNNILIGGRGNDTITGYDGNDTYIYHKGDGNDKFIEHGYHGNNDKLRLKGLKTSHFKKLERYGGGAANSFKIHLKDGSVLNIGKVYDSTEEGIEKIQFDNATWTPATIRNKIMAQERTNGHDTIIGFNRFNDTLQGLKGNDTLYGYDGNDTYIYNKGDGNDKFVESGYAGDNDKAMFNAINFAETTIELYGSNLDHATLKFHDDGGANTIFGWGGNDTIKGGNGNDVLFGGLGNDNLQGQKNNDKLYGASSADKLYGGDNNDMLIGGRGNDWLYGGNHNDTLGSVDRNQF